MKFFDTVEMVEEQGARSKEQGKGKVYFELLIQ